MKATVWFNEEDKTVAFVPAKKAMSIKHKLVLQGLTTCKTQLTVDGRKYVYIGLINNMERRKTLEKGIIAARCGVHKHYHGVLDVYPFDIRTYKDLLNKHGCVAVAKIVKLFEVITHFWQMTKGLPGVQWKGNLSNEVALSFSMDVTLQHDKYYGLLLKNFEIMQRIYGGNETEVFNKIMYDIHADTIKSKIVAEKLMG